MFRLNYNRWYKCILVFLIAFLAFIESKKTMDATSLNIIMSSTATVLQEGSEYQIPSVGSNEVVSYGTKLRLSIYVTNNDSNINAFLSMNDKEGIQFQGYYPGVLTINGQNVSAEQYAGFTTEHGMWAFVPTGTTKLTIEVSSIGTYLNRISTDVTLYSPEVTSGQKTQRMEHAFYGQFGSLEYVTISFYDGNELLNQQRVPKNGSFTIPTMKRLGHQFKGFNTQLNGYGSILSSNIATESATYYAMFELQKFEVQYYVGEELYHTEYVDYGKYAPLVKAPKKKSEFVRWEGEAIPITENRKLYALYEDENKISRDPSIKIKINKQIEGNREVETLKSHLIKNSSELENKHTYNEKKVEVIKNNKTNDTTVYILFSIGSIGLLLLLLRKKRK